MRTALALAIFITILLSAPACAHFSGVKFCIDPGHGGSDPGALGNGLRESDINLDISLRARDLLQLDAATIVMTRTTDVYVSLQGRCDVANNAGAARFVCSHCNAFNSSASGTETYCHPLDSSTAFNMRDNVQAEMVAHMGTINRGGKTAEFYVLANTNMAAILCEVAFIDSPSDGPKLANPAYRQEAAKAYLHGLQSHYGQAPHDVSACTAANNLRWTGGPAGSRWYRQNLRLSYAVDGSDPMYCRERAGSHDATYQTHSGYFDMNYGGLGWGAFRVDAWNDCGSQAIDHPMGWDNQAPVLAWSSSSAPGDTWLTGTQYARWSWSDAHSGIKSGWYRWNGGTQYDGGSGAAQLTEGKNTLQVYCEDDAWWDDGNHSGNSATISAEFWLDTTPPVPSISVSPSQPDGENGWYTTSPNLSVSAVDPNGANGSGVNSVYYTLDGAENPFTSPVSISGDAIHACSARATDVAGNSRSSPDIEVKLDTLPPVFDSIHTDAESGSLTTLVAAWNYSDATSGVALYEYSIYHVKVAGDELVDGPRTTIYPMAYVTNLVLTAGESYYFVVRAKDYAGLWTTTATSEHILAANHGGDATPNFNAGGVSVPEEARTSTNYRIVDSLGQLVGFASVSPGFVAEHGYWHSDLATLVEAASLGAAKAMANDQVVQVGSAERPLVVTAGTATFAGRFYVEDINRSSGIACCYGIAGGPTLVEGDKVSISGKLDTVDGERVLQFAAPTKVGHIDPLGPLYIGVPNLGGAAVNQWTPGVANGLGLNNVGLLVRTVGGMVSSKDDPQGRFFYLDNGDGLYDGDGYGIRVICDGFVGGGKLSMPAFGKTVVVTGISSVVVIGGQPVRAIHPRYQADIQVLD